MKQKWIRPQTTIEKFVPDEYIAACWGVACDVDSANIYEMKNFSNERDEWGKPISWYDLGCTHDIAHCGNSKNQVIYDYDGNGIPDEMIEEGTDGLGNLHCTISGGIGNVKIGSYIYWTTTSGNRTWHHQGKVIAEYPGRPNHS